MFSNGIFHFTTFLSLQEGKMFYSGRWVFYGLPLVVALKQHRIWYKNVPFDHHMFVLRFSLHIRRLLSHAIKLVN